MSTKAFWANRKQKNKELYKVHSNLRKEAALAKEKEARKLLEFKHLFPVGARCTHSKFELPGAIAYSGCPEPGLPFVVGIRLDEPFGTTNGTFANGKRYFHAGHKYGIFLPPELVEVSDVPYNDVCERDTLFCDDPYEEFLRSDSCFR